MEASSRCLKKEIERIRVGQERILEHFLNLQPQFTPEDDENGNPVRWGGNWSPGWCDLHMIQD